MLTQPGWLEKRRSDVETHKSALKPPSNEGLLLLHHCAAENLLPPADVMTAAAEAVHADVRTCITLSGRWQSAGARWSCLICVGAACL